jgi:hypothetical protein
MTVEAVAGDAYRGLVRRQTELIQQALLDGIRVWGRLWQPTEAVQTGGTPVGSRRA